MADKTTAGLRFRELNATFAANILGGATDFKIGANTSDGSDNAQLKIMGGGDATDVRGASIHLAGNEHGNAGLLQLRAGDGTTGGIRLYEGGSERMRISAGKVIISNTGSTGTPSGLLHIKGTGDAIRVESTNTGAGGAQIDLLHFTTSPADEDTHGMINMGGYYTGTTSVYGSQILSKWTDVSARHSRLEFKTLDTTLSTVLTLAHDKSATFTGSINLSDSQPIKWGTENILSHNGTQTYLGSATSASVLTLEGTAATFGGAITVGGNILASAGNSYDVGAAGTMFNNGYFLNVTAFTSLSAGSATFSGDVDINQSGTPVLSVTRNLGAGISPGTSIGFINFKNDASTSSDDRAVIFEGFTDGGSANATGGGLRIYTKIASNGNNGVALTIDNTQNTTFSGDVDFDENITLTGSGKNIVLDNSNELRSKDTSGTQRTIARVQSGNTLQYGWSGAGNVEFKGGGSYTTRMAISSSNGYIGIGESFTTPSAALHIKQNQGASNDAVLRLRGTNTTNRITRLQLEDYKGTLADGLIQFRIPTADTASSALLELGVNSAGLTLDHSNNATFTGYASVENTGNAYVRFKHGSGGLNYIGSSESLVGGFGDEDDMAVFTSGKFGVYTGPGSLALTIAEGNTAIFEGTLDVNGAAASTFYALQLARSGSGTTTPDIFGENNTLVLGTSASTGVISLSNSDAIFDGSVTVGNATVTSSTTNHENVLRVQGKNNYSDGTNWFGTYGQIMLHSDTNMTSSARRFLITNALGNNAFAIVRSVDGNTDPVVNSTDGGYTPNSGTVDFAISNTGNVGIGQAQPSSKLHVTGTSNITGQASFGGDVTLQSGDLTLDAGNISTTGSQFSFVSSTDSNVGLLIRDETYVSDEADITATRLASGNNLTLGLAGQAGINFYVGGSNVADINSSGNATFTGAVNINKNTNATSGLILKNGDVSTGVNSKVQIQFGFSGSTNFSHYIVSRHNSGNTFGNALDFYVGDTTQAGVYPTHATHNLTLENGRVGVGTTSPTSQFHVVGTSNFAGNVSFNPDSDSSASIKNAGTNAIALFAGASDELYLGANDTTGLYFNTNNTATFSGDIVQGSDSGNTTTTLFGNSNNLVLRSQASGTRAPEIKFNIAGTDLYSIVANNNTSGIAANTLTINQGSTAKFFFFSTGNFTCSGALSKGSGSFKIDHPLESKKDTHHLVHSFIEGPQADLIYRGKVDLIDGKAVVNIDQIARMTEGTFEALNRNIQCFTSNETDWDAVKGSVSGNKLTIECQNTNSTATISWMVVGERDDQHMKDTDWTHPDGKIIMEPEK